MIKGSQRPIVEQAQRSEIVASLQVVDFDDTVSSGYRHAKPNRSAALRH